MSRFWTDFANDAAGTVPSGWSLSGWLANEFAVVADGAASAGKALKLAPAGSNARRLALFNLAGTVADAEILIRCRTPVSQAVDRTPLIFRQQNALASLKAYVLAIFTSDVLSVMRYDTSPTSFPETFTATGLNHHNSTQWYFVRMRVQGGSIKARTWNDGSPEPASWGLEITDASPFTAGGLGLYAFYANGSLHIDFIGIGTNGDAAPSSRVVGSARPASARLAGCAKVV